MRRLLLALLTLAAVLLTAGPAAAKGPSDAVLDGPGLAEPVDLVRALGPMHFGEEVDRLGYSAAIGGFGLPHHPPGVGRPEGELGPMYTLVWGQSPQAGTDWALTVELYPHAAAGPRYHVPGGQRTFMGFHAVAARNAEFSDRTEDGWFVLTESALATLDAVGVPSQADLKLAATPESAAVKAAPGDGSAPGVPLAVAAVVLLGGLAVLARRRRGATTPRAAVLPA